VTNLQNPPDDAASLFKAAFRARPNGIVAGEIRGGDGEPFALVVATGRQGTVSLPARTGKFAHRGAPNRQHRKAISLAKRFLSSVINRYGNDLAHWPKALLERSVLETNLIQNAKSHR
jgi:hypothetical protein